jgi:uncharacterized membrane protein YphA (DoxX/SURF4 family)
MWKVGKEMQGYFGRELMQAKHRDLDASVARTRRAREVRGRTTRPRSPGRFRITGSAVRIVFGLVWLADASLKWLPGFRTSFSDMIRAADSGQPAWLHGWFTFWTNLMAPRASLFAYMVAVIETGIALALIFGFARKLTYLLAIAFTLMIWATAEGFGGPYTSGSSDVGTAIIYAVVFAALLVIEAGSDPDRYTADAWLEQRWPWWRRVAEIGSPAIDPRTSFPAGDVAPGA